VGPLPPVRPALNPADPMTVLHGSVIAAVSAIPGYFDSKTTIEGLEAGDLFSLNTVLGATIEVQVVKTLNKMRTVWDPDGLYEDYFFERQAQTFPDVRLVRRGASGIADIAMGIELKGWYLLAKEKVPSLRYRATPASCADRDLIVVVPWHLSNVLSGEPVAVAPWAESARYAAEYRNYWWTHVRQSQQDQSIVLPSGAAPYPLGADEISDKPAYDGGSNFGRIARIDDLMGEFIRSSLETPIAGIAAIDWVTFFATFVETRDPEIVRATLERRYRDAAQGLGADEAERLASLLDELVDLLGGAG